MSAAITIHDSFPLTDDETGSLIYELAVVAQTDVDTAVALAAGSLASALNRAVMGRASGPRTTEPAALRALDRALVHAAVDGYLPAGLDALRGGVMAALAG